MTRLLHIRLLLITYHILHVCDLLYVLHVNFGHNMYHSEDTAHNNRKYLILPLKAIPGQRS